MNAKRSGYYDIGTTEANQNANEIRSIFESGGYNTLSVAAVCGAFQQESQMNPWLWEGNDYQEEGNIDPNIGYGFPQFTPSTEYIGVANTYADHNISADYAPNFRYTSGNPTDGIAQCNFIIYHHIETSDGWLPSLAQRYRSILESYISTADVNAALSMRITNFKNGKDDNNNPYSIDALIAAFVTCYLRPNETVLQNNFGSRYLTYARWYAEYFEQLPSGFIPRLTADGIRYSKWWYSNGNVYYRNGYGLNVNNGNCTCYAYGRFAEIRNAFAELPIADAGYWYDNVVGFSKGNTPKLGAIACYKSASDPDNHPGHVSVVEEINGTTIKTSNSGWGGPFFWVATVDASNGYKESWMDLDGRDYYLQGFIYLDSYVPPTPPTPTPTDSDAHHIKPYYYINFIRRK